MLSVNCSTYLVWFLHPSSGAVDTVICALDDGRRTHLKRVEQLTDKINCVYLQLVGHLLT